ncbi:MAG: InlB B-repeat-containing protein [Bacteroidales bacterium]|nr:InlB B-repeat-containing protein [Bacteroidales bacterium]
MKRLLFPLLIVFTLLAVYSCGDDEDDGRTKFTVTFDTDGGSAVPSQTVKEGDKVAKPEDPTKDNAVFVGWYIGDDRFNFVSTTVTADITIKAVYRICDAFSISDTKQVYFAKGNLQYHCKNKEWRLAPNQYDYIGEDNANIADDYDGYIDLFGWGTGDNPTLISTNSDDYTNFTDWGVNIDGGNVWRTLTKTEWEYLISRRKNALYKYGVAQVVGVNGFVLLPDYFDLPEGLSFNNGTAGHIDAYHDHSYKDHNDYSSADWQKMEAAGAVFLPSAGFRSGRGLLSGDGLYWSSSARSGLKFYNTSFEVGYLNNYSKYCGFSVRLVRDL